MSSSPTRDRLTCSNSLAELEQLAETAGVRVVGETFQRISTPNSANFIGSGKLAEVLDLLTENNATAILFDEELSPRQQREIEKAVKNEDIKVLDRTALILDIFAKHAHRVRVRCKSSWHSTNTVCRA